MLEKLHAAFKMAVGAGVFAFLVYAITLCKMQDTGQTESE